MKTTRKITAQQQQQQLQLQQPDNQTLEISSMKVQLRLHYAHDIKQTMFAIHVHGTMTLVLALLWKCKPSVKK